MTRRLQIPGEREEAALLAACEQALARAASAGEHLTSGDELPDSYAAAGMALLGSYDSRGLESLWLLQNADGGFPLWPGGPTHIEASANVWAAMRLAGLDSPRLKGLARSVQALGGVNALSDSTKIEWALIGILPRDRACHEPLPAQVLHGMDRAGGAPRMAPLEEIGGPGNAAPPPGGFKTWWTRTFGAEQARRNLQQALECLEMPAREGSILDPRCRIAWLALSYAGRALAMPTATAPTSHSPGFTGGIAHVLDQQDPEGGWRDSEGIIHGTWQALRFLRAQGYDDHEAPVLRAGEWLRSAQNADGGWGETPQGEPAPSTVSHSAWALMALIAGGDPASESATRGLEYLLASQSPEGLWRDRVWTQVIEPGSAFARNDGRTQADARSAILEFMRVTARNRGTNG